MLFCSTSLAARIERAETTLVAEAARAIARRDADVFVRDLAGGVAAFTGPGSPLNKIAGLGFAGAIDVAALVEIEAVFAARAAPVQVEVSTLADPAVASMLTRRGYVLVGFENVLGRALVGDVAAHEASGTVVTRAASGELDVWVDTLVTGFAAPDVQGVAAPEVAIDRAVLEPVIRDFVAADTVSLYLARRDAVVVGGASMRTHAGIAQLCGAATLPAHRRRGVQTGLLTQRLLDATTAGCELAVLTTLPGSKSHENAQRRGFELLYTRAMLVRDPRG